MKLNLVVFQACPCCKLEGKFNITFFFFFGLLSSTRNMNSLPHSLELILIPMRLIAPFLSFFNLIYMMSVHHFLHHLGGALLIFSYPIWWTILRLSMASTDQERSCLCCSEPSNRSLLHWNESRKPEAVQARYMQDLGDISEDVFQSPHWPAVVLVTLTSLLYWVYLNDPSLEFSRHVLVRSDMTVSLQLQWHSIFANSKGTLEAFIYLFIHHHFTSFTRLWYLIWSSCWDRKYSLWKMSVEKFCANFCVIKCQVITRNSSFIL